MLANLNSLNLSKFLTLTFRQPNLATSLPYCLSHLKDFRKRLNRYVADENIQYICVPEKHKSGAYHLHLLCDMPYIPKPNLDELWGQGFVWIEALKDRNIGNYGEYLAKYMAKDLMPEIDWVKDAKVFTHTQGLLKKYDSAKVILKGENSFLQQDTLSVIEDVYREGHIKATTFNMQGENEYTGRFSFINFQLPPHERKAIKTTHQNIKDWLLETTGIRFHTARI